MHSFKFSAGYFLVCSSNLLTIHSPAFASSFSLPVVQPPVLACVLEANLLFVLQNDFKARLIDFKSNKSLAQFSLKLSLLRTSDLQAQLPDSAYTSYKDQQGRYHVLFLLPRNATLGHLIVRRKPKGGWSLQEIGYRLTTTLFSCCVSKLEAIRWIEGLSDFEGRAILAMDNISEDRTLHQVSEYRNVLLFSLDWPMNELVPYKWSMTFGSAFNSCWSMSGSLFAYIRVHQLTVRNMETQEVCLDFKQQRLLPMSLCFQSHTSLIVLLNFQIQVFQVKSSGASLILQKKKVYQVDCIAPVKQIFLIPESNKLILKRECSVGRVDLSKAIPQAEQTLLGEQKHYVQQIGNYSNHQVYLETHAELTHSPGILSTKEKITGLLRTLRIKEHIYSCSLLKFPIVDVALRSEDFLYFCLIDVRTFSLIMKTRLCETSCLLSVKLAHSESAVLLVENYQEVKLNEGDLTAALQTTRFSRIVVLERKGTKMDYELSNKLTFKKRNVEQLSVSQNQLIILTSDGCVLLASAQQSHLTIYNSIQLANSALKTIQNNPSLKKIPPEDLLELSPILWRERFLTFAIAPLASIFGSDQSQNQHLTILLSENNLSLDLVLLLTNLKEHSLEFCCRQSFSLSRPLSKTPKIQQHQRKGKVVHGVETVLEFSIERKSSKDYKTLIYQIQ